MPRLLYTACTIICQTTSASIFAVVAGVGVFKDNGRTGGWGYPTEVAFPLADIAIGLVAVLMAIPLWDCGNRIRERRDRRWPKEPRKAPAFVDPGTPF